MNLPTFRCIPRQTLFGEKHVDLHTLSIPLSRLSYLITSTTIHIVTTGLPSKSLLANVDVVTFLENGSIVQLWPQSVTLVVRGRSIHMFFLHTADAILFEIEISIEAALLIQISMRTTNPIRH